MDKIQTGFTIKVGVSRISVAYHHKQRIERIKTLKTPASEEKEILWNFFLGLWKDVEKADLNTALVCVVPDIKEMVKALWLESTGVLPKDFTPEEAPFVVDYFPPESLGADRSAAAWGASECFKSLLGSSFMVVDFGTHTVTTVCKEGHLLGGAILPGIPLMKKILGAGRVHLLSEEDKMGHLLSARGQGIGRTTDEGVYAGVVLGSVEAVLGLRKRAEEELGCLLPVVLTGGLALQVAPLFPSGVFVNRQIVHYGAWRFLAGR